ncbi:peroxiredoxin family protein [Bacillus sp. FJAT-45037]|uniref:peroxiredoxin family protein n=1 Tax=Bacillus sp. FJAT-45037 TaxID=2011007 RepID=UPI000C2477C8|nr:TlpA family protein disulfide reductase [Bacillus sp. FJAT-45037]
MRAKLVLLIVFGFVIWGVIESVSNQSSTREENEVEQTSTDLAPDFTLETLSGENVALSDFIGQPVMVNFWATWCPPCRAEMPDMEEFYQEEDVMILAVNATASETSVDTVRAFQEELELTFPILLDPTSEAASLYNIQPLPTSVFINRQGEVEHVQVGAMNKEMMLRVLEEL